jgi:hypothetical protein
MPEFNILFYITAEIAVVLLLLCLYLIFDVSKFKKQRVELELRIAELRKSLSQPKEKPQAIEPQPSNENQSYSETLDELLDATIDYYNSINPGGNITLDIGSDIPLDRLACSLRYAYLLAEKESFYDGDGEESHWSVLQFKLLQILDLYSDFDSSNHISVPASENSSLISENTDNIKLLENKIADMQQNHLNLQAKYIELEERYLELKEKDQ